MQLEPDRVVRVDHRLGEPVGSPRTHAFERVAEPATVALVTIEFGLQIDENRLDSFVELSELVDDAEVVVRVVVGR